MPAASESQRQEAPALPARFRPWGVRYAGWIFSIALLVVVVTVWLTLPQAVRDEFTPLQRGTVAAMYLVGAVIAHALGRCRVDAHEQGLRVVNGYRSHDLTWAQVLAVRMGPGDPWAALDLADGTSLAAMGIQGSDGRRARRQVRRLRALIDAHSGREPRP
jgi:hypothetical protein